MKTSSRCRSSCWDSFLTRRSGLLTASLVLLRARMVARHLDLENRWNTTFESASSVIEDCTRLKSSEQGVDVEVRR